MSQNICLTLIPAQGAQALCHATPPDANRAACLIVHCTQNLRPRDAVRYQKKP